MTRFRYRSGERFAPPVGPDLPDIAQVAESREATLEQMASGRAPDCRMVDRNHRHSKAAELLVEVDHRYAVGGHHFTDFRRRSAGNDAISPPVLQPFRDGIIHATLSEEHRPWRILP